MLLKYFLWLTYSTKDVLIFHVSLCLLSNAITFLLTRPCGGWEMMSGSCCPLGLGDSLAAFSLLLIGKFQGSCLPAHSFRWAAPLLCLSFAPKVSDFPSPPPVLLLVMTDLPEMLRDFAILLFRGRKTFFPHGETAVWLYSVPPISCFFSQERNRYTSYIFIPGFARIQHELQFKPCLQVI